MFKALKDCWKSQNSTNITDALTTLKEVSTLLKQQISKYDSDLNYNKTLLKTSIRNKESKQAKLYYLRKVKLLEYHMESARKRLLSLDQQQLNLESIKLTTLHLDAVKTTTNTLKSYMKQTDVEKVEDLTDKLADYIADATDISNLLNADMNPDVSLNDEELEEELEALTTQEETGENVQFPEIPRHKQSELVEIDLSDTNVSTPLMNSNSEQISSF